ncbi:MAG TPA: SGNH/GDSL hydrolase family protein, partial [Casimicrobiaceae bacterium]|nr:SGNH/GDSL hydrolase family protein [Casimicrobiaceae bacterium]
MMTMLRKALLASVCAAALVTGVAQAQFSNFYFFGDSLTDAGSYRPVLPPGTGRFTTNPDPVWAQILGERYGFTITPANQGGTDYAQGGARIVLTPGFPNQPPTASAVPIATQVMQQIGRGIDGGAAYALWGGANDIFTQLGLAQAGTITTAQAQAAVGLAASQYVQQVGALQAAGVRNIIVFNLPDIGRTPGGQAGGAAAAAQISAITGLYNTTVQTGLDTLGGNVIRVDIFALFNEFLTNPSAYGFTNTTTPACTGVVVFLCTRANLVAPNANQTHVFADGSHPTGAAHAFIASFVASLLEGPQQA